ncbi:MAG: hypothetical protein OEY19_06565 [Gammaproteobacteria bacterium]|nr:hypothetical protein [Gammaproteobacteria bacterium]MDH5629495.1 hypothetical protein [Gammaproteobacteria bacterium]
MTDSIEPDIDINSQVLGKALLNVISKYDDSFAVIRARSCHQRVMANIDDPKWSSQSFVDSIPILDEATSKTGIDAHRIFLSYLLLDLTKMEELPKNLIKELIIYYEWPNNQAELYNELLDTDVLIALILKAYVKQENLDYADNFVDKQYKKKVLIRNISSFLLIVSGIIIWVIYMSYK